MNYICVLFAIFAGIITTQAIKPTKFGKEVVCEGCHAVITESNKMIGQGSRKKAKNVITNVCTFENLRSYEFSPPNMKKVCDYWTSDYKEELLAVLSKDIDVEEQELELCFEVTDACVGVDRSNFRINKYKGPKARKVKADKEKKKEGDKTKKKKKKETTDKKTKTDRATKTNDKKDEL